MVLDRDEIGSGRNSPSIRVGLRDVRRGYGGTRQPSHRVMPPLSGRASPAARSAVPGRDQRERRTTGGRIRCPAGRRSARRHIVIFAEKGHEMGLGAHSAGHQILFVTSTPRNRSGAACAVAGTRRNERERCCQPARRFLERWSAYRRFAATTQQWTKRAAPSRRRDLLVIADRARDAARWHREP